LGAERDCEPKKLVSNTFNMVWPPKSGMKQTFSEDDRGAWLGRDEAFTKIVRGQCPMLGSFFARADHGTG
jgi:predicted NUDIX family NTP pyrophosphohydrolase